VEKLYSTAPRWSVFGSGRRTLSCPSPREGRRCCSASTLATRSSERDAGGPRTVTDRCALPPRLSRGAWGKWTARGTRCLGSAQAGPRPISA